MYNKTLKRYGDPSDNIKLFEKNMGDRLEKIERDWLNIIK